MVRESDLRVIQRLLSELNWGEDSLRKLLDGGRSPLGKRADKQIRTVSDANHVIWALKRFARRGNANKGQHDRKRTARSSCAEIQDLRAAAPHWERREPEKQRQQRRAGMTQTLQTFSFRRARICGRGARRPHLA